MNEASAGAKCEMFPEASGPSVMKILLDHIFEQARTFVGNERKKSNFLSI